MRNEIELAPDDYTTWHITWGTCGARLHGGDRPTVARSANDLGEAFVESDAEREERARKRMRGEAVYLTREQRSFIEEQMPQLCERGGWVLRQAAAGPDHVHVLCDVRRDLHGKTVRRWLKTWLTQLLSDAFGEPEAGRWWAEAGSTRAVQDESYLRNVTDYVKRQRTTQG